MEKNDYLIVYYSGHGGSTRTTKIEIGNDTLVDESELFGMCKKQLTIFDCCRSKINESRSLTMESKIIKVMDSDEDVKNVRRFYENLINEACE